MRATTEQLSQITNLLAIVSAPPIATTTIRHVEVLLLQPQVAMVVVITSTGGVTKRVISYDEPVDPGLVNWAASYLNETLGGMAVGARMLAASSRDPTSRTAERTFLATLAPAFTELEETAEDTLYVDGAARLLSEDRFQELSQIGDLMQVARAARRRCCRCSAARSTESQRLPADRRGERGAGAALAERRGRELRPARAQPRRRQRPRARADGLPEGDRDGAPGRGRALALRRRVWDDERAAVKRDPYEVLGVAATPTTTRSRRRSASSRASCTPTSTATTPRPRRSSRRAPRPTRSCRTPSAARSTTATATTACPRAASVRRPRASARSPTSSTRSSAATRSAAAAAAAGAVQGGDVAVAVEITLEQAAAGASVEVEYEAVDACEHCNGNGAEPGTPIETCERCEGAGELRTVARTAFGQLVRTQACDACGGDGKLAQHALQGVRRARAPGAAARKLDVDIPAGIADEQRIRLTGRGHAGERGGPAGDLYVLVGVREDERFMRDGNDLVSVVDLPAPAAALGTTVTVPTLDGDEEIDVQAGTQPGTVVTLRGKGMPSLGRGRRGDQRVVVNVVIPRNLTADQRAALERFAATLDEDNLREPEPESLLSKVKRALR